MQTEESFKVCLKMPFYKILCIEKFVRKTLVDNPHVFSEKFPTSYCGLWSDAGHQKLWKVRKKTLMKSKKSDKSINLFQKLFLSKHFHTPTPILDANTNRFFTR